MGAHGLVIPRKSHLRFRWNDVGAADLRRFAQGEADRCVALRALAIAQALEGASRAEAARLVGRERQSLRDAVARFKELSQDWGSGGYRHWRVWIVGWLELLSEAGTERAIVDGAAYLQQQVGAASRPAHLL